MRMMTNMMRRTYSSFGLAMAAAILQIACGSGEKGKEAAAVRVSGVKMETARLEAMPDVYEATGTVRSATTSMVTAQVPGTVLEVRVKAGDHVRRGQLLVVIDDRTSRAQLAGAQAGVEEASQGAAEVDQALAAATADRQFAEATFNRYQGLLAKQSVSKQEFEGAESRYKAALANERAMQAKRKQVAARGQQAASQKDSAQAVYSYSHVTSPIDGVVAAKSVDAGSVVMPGTPLVTVEDPSRYRLEASVPEHVVGKTTLGMKVSVDTGSGKVEGLVAEIVPAADPASRTFLVKIDLPREAGNRSGEYGTASIPVGEAKRLTVPRDAVVAQGQLEGVYVVGPEKSAEFRLVKTGKDFNERVEILSGLNDGERVAVSQLQQLRDGAVVEAQ
jgi:membrane fusion protein, multidrug efflux system